MDFLSCQPTYGKDLAYRNIQHIEVLRDVDSNQVATLSDLSQMVATYHLHSNRNESWFDSIWVILYIAGRGFEPRLDDPESSVLPLDDPAL